MAAMRKRFLLSLLTLSFVLAPVAVAQTVGELEQAAVKAQTDWFRLASDLDIRIARMLPCDTAATSAIDAVNRASSTRLVAFTTYTSAVAQEATNDAAMAHRMQTTLETAPAQPDANAQLTLVQSQLGTLSDSVRRRVSLTTAHDDLRTIEAQIRERANLAATAARSTTNLRGLLIEFTSVLDKRATLLRAQVAALEDERTRWNGYYAARLARARVECSASGLGR
jgi:hypothetical protein